MSTTTRILEYMQQQGHPKTTATKGTIPAYIVIIMYTSLRNLIGRWSKLDIDSILLSARLRWVSLRNEDSPLIWVIWLPNQPIRGEGETTVKENSNK